MVMTRRCCDHVTAFGAFGSFLSVPSPDFASLKGLKSMEVDVRMIKKTDPELDFRFDNSDFPDGEIEGLISTEGVLMILKSI